LVLLVAFVIIELRDDVAVSQPAVVVERVVGVSDGDVVLAYVGSDRASTLRTSACAHTAQNGPVVAPTTAAGLLRSGLASHGRETPRRR
jgi:hypothetical protein